MERDVSLLRCSKLSCYSEFNRMVQALARNGGEGDITTIPGTRPQKGTSAEYNFYTTLVLMLKQVISNADPVTQKRELQRVYEWFCLNKPLIRSKTKPTQQKPKLSITSTSDKMEAAAAVPFPFPELDRPQTAPASLYQTHRLSSESAGVHSGSRRGNLPPPRRQSTFTAMYVNRSLSRGMDLIGQPLDQLQLRQKQMTVPSRTQETISSPMERADVSKATDNSTPAKESQGSTINLINLPSSDFPPYQSSSGQRPGMSESTVSLAAVFSMAPGVAAQMILERELNDHYQSSRKRMLSLHTAQMLRIGGDYQPNGRLVTTPTDRAMMEPLNLKRYSTAAAAADSISISERLKQHKSDSGDSTPSAQASPRHQGQKQIDSKSPRSAVKSRHDTTNATDHSSNLMQNQVEKPSISQPEGQEMMLDMKAVDSGASVITLSQVSLIVKQNDSPRTKYKRGNHDDDAASHLQIEGQGVTRTSPETVRQTPRLVSTAAQRDHKVDSVPKSSTGLAHEVKSGNQTSLIIRPVSLQHHSGKATATSLNQEQKVDKNSEKGGDIDTDDIVAPGDQDGGTAAASDANNVTKDSEMPKIPPPEGSLIRPEVKEVTTKFQDRRDAAQDKANNEENSTSANSLVDKKSKDGVVDILEKELSEDGAADSVKELAETDSSIAHDLPGSREILKSPVVVVKTSSTPVRPLFHRPVSSSRKSRLPSPMNVVSLSFPSDKPGSGQQVKRHTTAAEAVRKTPTIIAGFNKKRYRRLKSSPATAEDYGVL